MPPALEIKDGNPVWASQSILPSKDPVVSPGSSPTLAAISVNSQDVFVYVKVENTGNVDLGKCPCTAAVPATWAKPPFFAGYGAGPPAAQTTQQNAGTTFTRTPYGDSISGTGFNHSFGLSAGQCSWAWSPDGRLFARVSSSSAGGTAWDLSIVALQNITRPNGTTVNKGQQAAQASGVFAGAWMNGSFFGWASSRAVVVSGASPGGGTLVNVSCPYSPGGNSWGTLTPATPGQVDWMNLVSPCGAVVALTPRILVAGNQRDITAVFTDLAQAKPFTKNNASTSGVTITGANPTIKTIKHAANGVEIFTGTGTTTVDVDDPDCLNVVGGGVIAWVDRVRASTLPNANSGVLSVGSGAASLIKKSTSLWVQVPNTNPSGWANQGVPHWCLLAQAYTDDWTTMPMTATIPKPWNGQAASPPPYPIALPNCAQRNVMIS
jgi:hypothetical protein